MRRQRLRLLLGLRCWRRWYAANVVGDFLRCFANDAQKLYYIVARYTARVSLCQQLARRWLAVRNARLALLMRLWGGLETAAVAAEQRDLSERVAALRAEVHARLEAMAGGGRGPPEKDDAAGSDLPATTPEALREARKLRAARADAPSIDPRSRAPKSATRLHRIIHVHGRGVAADYSSAESPRGETTERRRIKQEKHEQSTHGQILKESEQLCKFLKRADDRTTGLYKAHADRYGLVCSHRRSPSALIRDFALWDPRAENSDRPTTAPAALAPVREPRGRASMREIFREQRRTNAKPGGAPKPGSAAVARAARDALFGRWPRPVRSTSAAASPRLPGRRRLGPAASPASAGLFCRRPPRRRRRSSRRRRRRCRASTRKSDATSS